MKRVAIVSVSLSCEVDIQNKTMAAAKAGVGEAWESPTTGRFAQGLG